ncbi:MAG: TldD/PmbA family protein [Symbiobacteriaceae bacterium]|nr:TldD/PmbA family protein [Symbiobacteriaceae bacterium]
MIAKALAEEALKVALSSGGDFAEIFCEDSRSNNLNLIAGKLETAQSRRSYGVGIRIFQGTRTVYAYSNDMERASLLDCARQAAAALGSAQTHPQEITLTPSKAAPLHLAKVIPWSVSGAKKVAKLKDAHLAAMSVSSEIAQVQVSLMENDQNILIANSEGLYVSDYRVRTRLSAQVVASNGKENQTGFAAPGASMGFEIFDTMIDPAVVGAQAAHSAVTMLHAPLCPAGMMPVVIEKDFGGVIFHEACGHSLEATSVARGNSVFSGKLGQVIASPLLTAVDEGLMPYGWGSTTIDDEGMTTGYTVLIDKGVLTGYLIDRLGSRRMGMPRTGSGRRQSYQYAPTSRMRNTYIYPGEDDEEEMIATMGDGLFAKDMGGGSVNPVTGEFNFAVREAYLVKDGKIAHAVRGASLIGKGSEIIKKIDRVGRIVGHGPGMCGSASGSVPANCGQPRIRVSEITVGGRQG